MYDRIQRRLEAKIDALLQHAGLDPATIQGDVEMRPPTPALTEAEKAAIANAPATPVAVERAPGPRVDPITNAPVTPAFAPPPDPVTNAPSTPSASPATAPVEDSAAIPPEAEGSVTVETEQPSGETTVETVTAPPRK